MEKKGDGGARGLHAAARERRALQSPRHCLESSGKQAGNQILSATGILSSLGTLSRWLHWRHSNDAQRQKSPTWAPWAPRQTMIPWSAHTPRQAPSHAACAWAFCSNRSHISVRARAGPPQQPQGRQQAGPLSQFVALRAHTKPTLSSNGALGAAAPATGSTEVISNCGSCTAAASRARRQLLLGAPG